MRVPVSWLRDYVPLEMPLERAGRRGSRSRPRRSRASSAAACPTTDGNLGLFRVGRCSRPPSTRTPTGSSSAASTSASASRGRSSAAPGTSAPARPSRSRFPGAVLPDGLQLEQRKVRGELSDGMILAEDEVELGTDHSGIMVLPETEPGTPLGDVAPARRGRARSSSRPATAPTCSRSTGSRARSRRSTTSSSRRRRARDPQRGGDEPVDIDDRRLRGLPALHRPALPRRERSARRRSGCEARLRDAGMRPISNVVDVTNYVMLALGNPLHAFDLTDARTAADRRPPRTAGRDDSHARRRRARSSSRPTS